MSTNPTSPHPMLGVNDYWHELTPEEMAAGEHRRMVGALWDELGQLQFDFLLEQGLGPQHRVLDMGCGSLRAGIHLVRYLEPGNYCGLDINASLLEGGRLELAAAGLEDRGARLLADDAFRASRFGTDFHYVLAQSLFTHLSMDHIVRCLVEVRRCLAEDGKLYATFFEAQTSAHIEPIVHQPGNTYTHYDRDVFHQSAEELTILGRLAGLEAHYHGPWNHPRDQRLMVYSLAG
jgi:SAM-dependent methyltransferase